MKFFRGFKKLIELGRYTMLISEKIFQEVDIKNGKFQSFRPEF